MIQIKLVPDDSLRKGWAWVSQRRLSIITVASEDAFWLQTTAHLLDVQVISHLSLVLICHWRTVVVAVFGRGDSIVHWTLEATVLGVGCHTEACHHHGVVDGDGALIELGRDVLIWENLVNAFNLGREVEVLRDLLDALADHGSLDDIFCSNHGSSWYSRSSSGTCAERDIKDEVSGDLGARRENLPDFEWAFKLDCFNGFHRIYVLGCVLVPNFGHDSSDFVNACSVDFSHFPTVKSRNISTATTYGSLGTG
jgi:hypothetical protein